jgi:hypothetical protein
MRCAPVIPLALLLCAGCGGRSNSRASKAGNANVAAAPTAASATATPTDVDNAGRQQSERKAEVPAEFKEVDFRNFTYPLSVDGKRVRLREGEFEYEHREGGAGWVSFKDVTFVDLDGDGKREAVVRLSLVSCGVSCDGGSALFYFYTIKNGRPALLTEITTGSLAYECGLKSFALNGGKLTVEVFRECRHRGGALFSGQISGKFDADKFTRFNFEFTGKKFALRKREVLPYPEGRILGYSPTISISDE